MLTNFIRQDNRLCRDLVEVIKRRPLEQALYVRIDFIKFFGLSLSVSDTGRNHFVSVL